MGIDKDRSQFTAATELRRRAEERLRAKTVQLHPPRNEEEMQRFVHELEVHQIELEMQGEEFQQARDDAEAALEKYADLYDFAPVGYLTLDHEGIIRSVNLTGASLLGVERSRLLGRRFGLLVALEARPFFSEFLGKIFKSPAKEACEVALLKEGNSPLFVRIEGMAAAAGQECRIVLIDITERKRAEEELRESEERLRQLIDGAKDYAIFMLDVDGRVASWNEGAKRLKGWDAQEILGRNFSLFYTGEAVAAGQPEHELEIATAAGQFTEEGWRVRKDGSTFMAEVMINAIRDESGKLRGFSKITRDITDRKRTEEALRKSEEKFRGLFNWMGEAIQLCELVWDEQGQPVDNIILDVNPAYENETGLTREQVVGRRIKEILPVVEQAWLDRYGEILRTRKPIHFEEYNASIDRWFDVFASPMEGNRFAVAFSNVTDRKRAEEAVRQGEEQFRALADSIPNLAWWANSDGYITWYNRRWYEYSGTTPEQMEGWGWQSVHDPNELPKVLERWQASISSGDPFEMTFPLLGADGIFRPFLTRVIPLKDAAGRVLQWFGTNTDVSELKQAEEALAIIHEQTEADRRRLEAILETIPVGVVLIEAGTNRFSLINRRAAEIYGADYDGFNLEDHIARVKLLQPDGTPFPREDLPVSHTWKGEEVHNVEMTIERVNGIRVPLVVNTAPLRDAEGNVITAVVTFDDITDRKRSEEELDRLARQRQLALDAAHMGWWHYDPITQVASWDDGYKEIFSVTGHQSPNEEILARIHPDDLPGVWTKVEAALEPADPHPYVAEYRINLPDGSIRWIEAYGVASFKGEGDDRQATSFVGTVADITDRKRAVEQVKTSLAEKEVMLREIHHRVKNNLQVIASLVGLQAEATGNETVREVLRDVTYRVRSMALVHEKLYQTGDLARIDFAEYARSLLSYLWRAHGSAAAAIRLTYDLEPLSLPVDTAVPCGLILNELAGNALKHAFRGRSEGEVTVSLRGVPEGCITLSLRDNGIGMPEGLDWRQASSLGLRLVQMLTEQLNATVELDRSSGTEFRMTFILPETAKDGELIA